MKQMEGAVTHGYLGARVKGYADKRHPRAVKGKPLSELSRDLGAMGFVVSGASPDGPVH